MICESQYSKLHAASALPACIQWNVEYSGRTSERWRQEEGPLQLGEKIGGKWEGMKERDKQYLVLTTADKRARPSRPKDQHKVGVCPVECPATWHLTKRSQISITS